MVGRFILALFAALLSSGAAQALEYKSLADNAVVYDAGSRQATPLFILLKATPVEVIVSLESWIKIRESGGGIGWLERKQLTDARQLIVTAANADIRAQADDAAAVVLQAAKDVLLDQIEPPVAGWVKVRHRDGATGFVRIRSVWGI